MNNKTFPVILLIAIRLTINACTHTEIADKSIKPVWPSPPATARIAFEQSFSSATDLGISKSIWQWLGSFIFGRKIYIATLPLIFACKNIFKPDSITRFYSDLMRPARLRGL